MKHLYIFSTIVFLVLATMGCEDADDKIDRSGNEVTVYAGTRFVLYDMLYNPLDTVVVEETRTLRGTTSIQENEMNVGYSINGLDYKFNTYHKFNNIFFNFEGNQLTWIGSSSINSGFFYEGVKIDRTDKMNIVLEFSPENPATDNNYFTSDYDSYNILIEGKISFKE